MCRTEHSQEREPITEGGDGDAEASVDQPKSIIRDGAAPCMALTALLVGVAIVGSVAVGIAIAAFDPPEIPAPSNVTIARHNKPTTANVEGGVRSLSPKSDASWAFSSEWQDGASVWHVTSEFTWASAVAGLKNGTIGPLLTRQLARSPHAGEAYYFETPPLTLATAAATPFRFVTVRAPPLVGLQPDATPFSQPLAGCETGGARAFDSLGGDAVLVAPCADGARSSHAHLGAFVRAASEAEQLALWREVGAALDRTLRSRGDAPTWVSTEGSGVSWLHIRLDSSPKYYHHFPFRRAATSSRRLGARRTGRGA